MFHSLVDSVPVGHLQNKSIPRSSLKRSPHVDNFVQNHYRSFILTLKFCAKSLQKLHSNFETQPSGFFSEPVMNTQDVFSNWFKKKQEVEQVLSQCNTITNWLTAKNFYTQYMFTCLISFVAEALTTFLVTARKRSLGQGHIFQVFVCPQRGVSVWYHFLCGSLVPCSFWGVCLQERGSASRGSASSGVCLKGVFLQGVCLQGNPPNQKSGRYASYLECFLAWHGFSQV